MDMPIMNKRFYIKMNNGECLEYTTSFNLFGLLAEIQTHEHFMVDGGVIIFTRNISSVEEA